MSTPNNSLDAALALQLLKAGTHNPSLVATDGAKGTVYIMAPGNGGAPSFFQKLDNGLSTNWSEFDTGTGAGDIKSDGSVPFAADESMGGFSLKDVADPVDPQDAATKNYVDTTAGSGDIKSDGSVPFAADESMGGFSLKDVADPVAPQDAATKNYVDNAVGSNVVTAGEGFAANTSFAVRWNIRDNGGAENTPPFPKVFKPSALNNEMFIGFVRKDGSAAVNGDPITIYKFGPMPLGSADAPFGASDVGRVVYLGEAGAFTLIKSTTAYAIPIGIVQDVNTIFVLPSAPTPTVSLNELQVYLRNNFALTARNAANSGFVDLLKLNASDVLEIVRATTINGVDFSITGAGKLTTHKIVIAPSAVGIAPVAADSGKTYNMSLAGAANCQLPNPSVVGSGFHFYIKDAIGSFSSFNLTLVRFAAEKIENATSDKILSANFLFTKVYTDGVDWWVS